MQIKTVNSANSDFPDSENEENSQVAVVDKIVPKKPSMYKVLLLNDDYTPMDFVVEILQKYFNKNYDLAMKLMLEVHHKGHAVCGIYTFEVAETKVKMVTDEAKARGYPLKCILEK